MSDNEDCKACETIFAAHQDERPAILLSQLNALHSKYTLHVAGHVLAAAEERGRRSGVEERDELLNEARAFIALACTWREWPSGLEMVARIDAALAPRDSVPVCDAVLSSDPFREWRCGKPKNHEGPHSGDAPRDSGKEG